MTATVAWMRERMRTSAATPSGSPVQVRASSAGSELSRQVPVDLEPDADLNEGRGAPGHWSSSLAFPSSNKIDRGTPPRKPAQPRGGSTDALTQQGNSIAGPRRAPGDNPSGVIIAPGKAHSMPGGGHLVVNESRLRGCLLVPLIGKVLWSLIFGEG